MDDENFLKDKFKSEKTRNNTQSSVNNKNLQIFRDFCEISVNLGVNKTLKGQMSIINGIMPGKVTLEVNSSKFSFMIYFTSEAFFKNKPDRTYITRTFELNSNKKITQFYFVL